MHNNLECRKAEKPQMHKHTTVIVRHPHVDESLVSGWHLRGKIHVHNGIKVQRVEGTLLTHVCNTTINRGHNNMDTMH